MTFECLYDSTPHLDVKASPTVLAPGRSETVPVLFYPREERAYREDVEFEVNTLSKVVVTVLVRSSLVSWSLSLSLLASISLSLSLSLCSFSLLLLMLCVFLVIFDRA